MNRDVPHARAYAWAYACVGAIAILIFAFAIPPYQSSDEPAHYRRADQISRGGFIAHRIGEANSGGTISSGIDATSGIFFPAQGNARGKATAEMFTAADKITWANSATVEQAFSNTALYPPLLYLPGAAGILAGKLAGMGVVSTLRLVRVVNGLFSIAIGAAAIALAGAAAPWIFAVLSLPMSLSLMASASHDGPMFAFAALAAAILFNSYPGGRFAGATWAFATMCGAIALVASARPTYAPLVVLPLLASGQSLARRLLAVVAIMAVVGAWSRIVAPFVLFQIANGADPPAQAALLRSDPLQFLAAVTTTVRVGWRRILEMFVGELGWIDTALPQALHLFARAELLVALAMTAAALTLKTWNVRALVTAAAIVAGVLGVFLSLYIVWTAPGGSIIAVHGRYFIPVAVFVPAAIPFAIAAAPRDMGRAAFVALVLFPPVSIAVTLYTVLQRYY